MAPDSIGMTLDSKLGLSKSLLFLRLLRRDQNQTKQKPLSGLHLLMGPLLDVYSRVTPKSTVRKIEGQFGAEMTK